MSALNLLRCTIPTDGTGKTGLYRNGIYDCRDYTEDYYEVQLTHNHEIIPGTPTIVVPKSYFEPIAISDQRQSIDYEKLVQSGSYDSQPQKLNLYIAKSQSHEKNPDIIESAKYIGHELGEEYGKDLLKLKMTIESRMTFKVDSNDFLITRKEYFVRLFNEPSDKDIINFFTGQVELIQATTIKKQLESDYQIAKSQNYDHGKQRWDLIPWSQLSFIADVISLDAKINGENTWKSNRYSRGTLSASMIQHIIDWLKGIDNDPESNLPHLAHAVTNALFLLYFDSEKNL